jgi:Aspartyl protease
VAAGRRALALVALAALAVIAVVLVVLEASPAPGRPRVRVEPEVNFALPPATTDCAAAATAAFAGARVPVTVSSVAGQVAETVNVCIDGQGPYPFVLDSGAGQSTIDTRLAGRLHLRATGPVTEFQGVGCSGQARTVGVASWSLAGVGLAPQELSAASLPQVGGRGEPVGLLGSDVLSRFGAVRLDFLRGALVLGGPEGPPPTSGTPVVGPVGPPPPGVLTNGGAGTTVPVTVDTTPGDVSLAVPVQFVRGPRRSFIVDTGSSQSVVSAAVARAQRLGSTNLAQRQATVCSTITVPLVRSGRWSVPRRPLRPQLLDAADFGTIGFGIDGLMGSDQLKHFGWVVFDYRGARLVLGSS